MRKQPVSRRIAVVALFTLSFACPVKSAPAPDSSGEGPVVSITPAQARVFDTALQALSDGGHVAILAEGRPAYPRLTAEVIPSLPVECQQALNSLPTTPEPLGQLVQAVAACYDYDAQKVGTVFVLTKCYNITQDIPSVTLAECLSSLEDVQRLTNIYNPNVPPEQLGHREPLVGDLVASLTPEQMQAMQNKTLRVDTLSSSQQALVSRMAAFFYVQFPVGRLDDTLAPFKEATKAHSQLVFRVGTSGEAASTFEALSPFSATLSNATSSDTPCFGYQSPKLRTDGVTFHMMHVLGRSGEATPAHSEIAAPGPSPAAMTLGDAVAQLSLSDKGLPAVSVAPMLSAKTVTVAGLKGADPKDTMRGFAAMYGLRVIEHDDGGLALARPGFLMPRDITELDKSIRQALPAPFLRLMHTDETDAEAAQQAAAVARTYEEAAKQKFAAASGDPAAPGTDPKPVAVSVPALPTQAEREVRRTALKDRFERHNQVAHAIPFFHTASALRLQRDLLAGSAPPAHWSVPVAKLTDDEQQAFATYLMTEFLSNVAGSDLVSGRVPAYIADSDQLYLIGGYDGYHPGTGHLGVFLGLPTPDGRVYQTVGLGYPVALFPN